MFSIFNTLGKFLNKPNTTKRRTNNMTTFTIATSNVEDNASVVLTRTYKIAATGEVKQGPITLRKSEIASVVPSNRLGKAKHRSTITLKSGVSFDLADIYSEVVEAVFGVQDSEF
jgi:hypothetical protein